jgi:hypothetical protein
MGTKLPRKVISDLLNRHSCVQVACTYSNVCRWQHLTTSGKVCREEYGYIDDADTDDPTIETVDLPVMTWASVKRLQRTLEKLSMGYYVS